MRILVTMVVLGLLVACGGGGGGGGGSGSPPVSQGTRLQAVITSVETAMTYNYQVFLPAGYAQSTLRYPVIYAADGEYRFPVLSAILEAQRRNVILVNVWHMGGERRYVDFTMPGAQAYYRFLTRELVPAIDAMYRTQTDRRAYSGHSLSGAFALYALYLEAPGQRFFDAFISADGSFWVRPDAVFEAPLGSEPSATMEREMFTRDRSLPVSLVLAGDSHGNATRVAALHNHLAGRGYDNLRLHLYQSAIGHLPSDGPAFQEALTFIYGNP